MTVKVVKKNAKLNPPVFSFLCNWSVVQLVLSFADGSLDTVYSNSCKDSSVKLLSVLSNIHLKVVQRKEGLGLSSLLLDVLNAVSAGLLRVNNDGVHVLAQYFGHSNLVLLLSGLAQVNQTTILRKKKGEYIFH